MKKKKVGILTSGGDSPGMNAAIRSIVRTGIIEGLEVLGIKDGYLGLCQNRMINLDRDSVSNMINRGGTFLGSARYPEFNVLKNRLIALDNIKKRRINFLVVIGGDGSYIGAKKLTDLGIPCIAIPGTIDNDVVGTDYSIGHLTAVETVVEAIDRLRDTSSSHQRISIVEVMGRRCGDLTLSAAIAGGCEFIVLPGSKYRKENLLKEVKISLSKGKKHAIIVITENICDVNDLAKYIEKHTKRETRATILGHIQRGGKPIAYDRILASSMGCYSVELLLKGFSGHCIGIKSGKMVSYEIEFALKNMKKSFNQNWFNLLKKLF